MKKKLIMRYLRDAAFISMAALGVAGCSASTSPGPAQGDGYITFRAAVDNSMPNAITQSTSHGPNSASGNTVDSIEITSAGFFVSNMLFFSNSTGSETDPSRTEIILRDDHFIIDFESWAKQYIGDKSIIPSTYRSIRFTMKAGEANTDSLSAAIGPLYNTFFRAAGGSTIVIRGNVWVSGQKMAYEYHSALSGNELAIFDNAFTVSSGDLPKEVDIQLRTSAAFGGNAGALLDPRDSRNSAAIEGNLKTSLKAMQSITGS